MFRSSRKASKDKAPAPPPAAEPNPRIQILLAALNDLASTLDLDEVLDRILARSLEVCEAEQALVLLGNRQKGLMPRRARTSDGKTIEAETVAFSTSTVRRVLEENVIVIQELGSDTEALEASQSLFDLKLRSVMCAPLEIRGEVVGAIYLDSRVQRKTFAKEDKELFEALARQAAIAIQNAQLMKVSVDRARMTRELELASEIQKDLLPAEGVDVPGLEAAGRNIACEEISGDFYDFVVLDDGRVVIWVADVSGHGVGPALLAAEVRGEIRVLLDLDPDPGLVLSRVHDNLRDIMDPGRFLTGVLAVIDIAAGTLSYASAGHCESVLYKGGESIMLQHTGPPLGIDVDFKHESVRLDGISPGDGMLLYTDGLVEARNGDGELFGEERLAQLAIENTGTAKEQVDAMLKAVSKFNTGPRNDDRTVVVVLWK